jgi:hypothetical protein
MIVGVSVMGTAVKVTNSVAVGLAGAGAIVLVAVTNAGVGVCMDGVIVGGGAGKVGTVYSQPSQAVREISKNNAGARSFFIFCSS